jgi:uncharacterized protein (DUF1697 family)
MKYVAMLRGINVGGNKKVPMETLKDQFSQSGFKEVQTLLNTGNVIFDSNESIEKAHKRKEEDEKIIFTFAYDLNQSELDKLKAIDKFDIVKSDSTFMCIRYSIATMRTPEVMKPLDKILKKRGTSRNYNTVKKIVAKIKD